MGRDGMGRRDGRGRRKVMGKEGRRIRREWVGGRKEGRNV